MTNPLEVVRAGAGSGKTTDLCDSVAKGVAAGLDPARILATTFTRKAAAELKGRIQTKLLEGTNGDWTKSHGNADRLDLAAIGTVHSVAHQLLVRYAIPLGLSPRLKVLIESGSDHVLRDLVGMMASEGLDNLSAVADRLSIDNLYPMMLKLLAVKRGNQLDNATFCAHIAASSERLCQLLAPNGPSNTPVTSQMLYEAIEEALGQIEQLTDATKTTKDAVGLLRRLLAAKDSAWRVFLQAAKIAAGKKSGADNRLNDIRTHGGTVRLNPELHRDIRLFNSLLAEQVVELDGHYRSYKHDRGLVDFTDLELTFLQLLETPALEAHLRADFDLVLVDEFQDTNPLQLAIFQALRRLARRSRWVGDPKQAIYGFRETDPQVVNDVWENAENATREKLASNYRSQRGLVELVGKLFTPIFDDETAQIPQKPPLSRGIERWIFESSNQPSDCMALACGVAMLRAEGGRLGDIAILERSNRLLKEVAGRLDSLGIPYLMESPGLLSTREGALILAGLRLVADRHDALAATAILHILDDPAAATPSWLVERLTAVRAAVDAAAIGSGIQSRFPAPWEKDARLALIDAIDAQTLTPILVTQRVIEALNVPQLISKWADVARRSSHIDSLLQHAADYEEMSRENGAATTLTGLIVYLEQLADNNLDMRIPPLGHNAVTLLTYHLAKGLEWPVVILSGLDSTYDVDLWSPAVGQSPANGAGSRSERMLRSWTWPFGISDGPFPKKLKGSGLEDDAAMSPEGQRQSAQEAEESLRLLYVGFTRAKYKLILAHRKGAYDWLRRLTTVDGLLDPNLPEGEHPLADIETTYVVRRLTPDMAESCRQPVADREKWLPQVVSGAPKKVFPPRYRVPTNEQFLSPAMSFTLEQLPGMAHFPSAAKEDQYTSIGQAVHAYMAALPSLAGLTTTQKEAVALRCLTGFGVNGVLTADALAHSGDRFVAWVEKTFPAAAWSTEVPVTVPHADNGQWNGTIDLLLTLPNCEVVLIDHKSAPLRRDACLTKAATFSNQLLSYQEILRQLKVPVRSTWIHFPLPGVLAEMRVA
jgi:superfamily I DNA/RNA helicase